MESLVLFPRNRAVRLAIFVVPFVLIAVGLYVKVALGQTYDRMIQEDAVFENLTCVIYFTAFLFAVSISVGFFRRGSALLGSLYVILSLCFIFIFLEEISWGQRIFNINTPEFFRKHNFQGELTFHNVRVMRPVLHGIYIVVGLVASLAWIVVPRRERGRSDRHLEYFVPDWFLSSYFFAVIFIYTYYEFAQRVAVKYLGWESLRIGTFFVWRDQEPAELLLALGFLLFVVINKYRQIRHPAFGVG